MPEVSVCIPAYNAEATISETLDSVWSQKFTDFEVVVVDDRSSDATVEILHAQRDPRLRFVVQGQNLGVAPTSNHAFSLARGRYIKFLDSDDLLHVNAIGRLRDALNEHPSASLAFCRRTAFLEEAGDEIGREWIREYSDLPDRFGTLSAVNDGRDLLDRWLAAGASGNWIGEPVCVMARRESVLTVGGQDPRIRSDHELGLWLKLLAVGDAAFVDETLASYRVRRGGMTRVNNQGDRRWLDLAWAVADLWQMAELRGSSALLREARRRKMKFAIRQFISMAGTPGSLRRARELRALGRALLGA